MNFIASISAAMWLRVLAGIFTSSIGVQPRVSWDSIVCAFFGKISNFQYQCPNLEIPNRF
jgi:hypothetical protein